MVGQDGKLLFIKIVGFFFWKAGATTEMFCIGFDYISFCSRVCMFVCVAGGTHSSPYD